MCGLKRSSIATSAVDLDTDRAIQEIIRGPLFDEVTILTIAYVSSQCVCVCVCDAWFTDFLPRWMMYRHRLNTIIESTKVLVLDQGQVAEFDAPGVLLADRTSRFYGMAVEAGLVRDGERGEGPGTEEKTD